MGCCGQVRADRCGTLRLPRMCLGSQLKPAYLRKAAIRPDNREVKPVPAYSHSDRWVGVSAAWGGTWFGVGEIRWSQII